jgi:hypothetical protein
MFELHQQCANTKIQAAVGQQMHEMDSHVSVGGRRENETRRQLQGMPGESAPSTFDRRQQAHLDGENAQCSETV